MVATKYFRAAIALLTVLQVSIAQECYYPNGKVAADSEKPCSSAEGSACCPDKWECMDNGLCYYPPDKIYGRYSCTDKDWESSGCPSNMCTYDMKAVGGEAVVQCSNHNNNWCCDANRVDVDCCQEKPVPRPFFQLQNPVAYGTAGGKTGSSAPNLAAITGKASGSSSPSSTSPSSSSALTTKSSDSSTSPSSTSAPTQVTAVSTSVSSGTAGLTTVVVTTVLPPSATSTADPSSSTSEKKSNVPVIAGCATGIPLGIALIGILIWLFRKHAHQKNSTGPYANSTDAFTPSPTTIEFAGGAELHKQPNGTVRYEHADPAMSELGGQSVGPDRPVSTVQGRAELASGGEFAPGTTPQAPQFVGMGGGNGHGNGYGHGHASVSSIGSTVAPGYSPSLNRSSWASEPEGGYIPYRPPQVQRGLSDVQEVAELPTVRTPSGIAELGGPTPPAREEFPGMGDLEGQREQRH